jgi:hypothetical protein
MVTCAVELTDCGFQELLLRGRWTNPDGPPTERRR